MIILWQTWTWTNVISLLLNAFDQQPGTGLSEFELKHYMIHMKYKTIQLDIMNTSQNSTHTENSPNQAQNVYTNSLTSLTTDLTYLHMPFHHIHTGFSQNTSACILHKLSVDTLTHVKKSTLTHHTVTPKNSEPQTLASTFDNYLQLSSENVDDTVSSYNAIFPLLIL